ncbi:MAG: phage tail protein, partial [Prevotella sp.]|nr:phage tail protein [Prevotella sp.]
MKKIVIWFFAVLLTPVLLFVVLAVLLYLPPVQNWVADKVASIVSEKTGMTVRVGYVKLEWPLNLGLDDFLMVHEGDTLADVGHLTADVKLRPLFDKRVVINELSLNRAKLNTNGFISDLRLKGRVGELWLHSNGIDLERETAEVNGARLVDADLDIALSDTAAVDTTESVVRWRINADSVSISRTRLALHMPGDSLHVNAYLGHSVAREADINLESKTYRIGGLDMVDGDFSLSSVDYQLADVQLGVDSIYYGPEGTHFYVRQAALREPVTGLQLTELQGGIRLDTAFTHITLPAVVLRTPDSDIEGEVDLDFNTFDAHNPGKLRTRLNAQIGKQDLVRLASLSLGHSLSSQFWRRYPNRALTIKGSLNGNMQRLEFTGLDVSLPT